MPQENVEIVRSSLDAYSRGDMRALGALHDPDAVWAAFEGWPEAETLVGREACMRQWERIRTPFEVCSVEPTSDFLTAGDRVLVRVDWRARGTGPEMSMELTLVIGVRAGKVVTIENFWDHADALRAVGLEA